ncbi:Toxin co-regulated pilus biosynthesis protein Q [Thalassospira xiamenensis M-5 = DSM 17429]|uniref:Toxin co-regulated pilus biosynthesis protein Q C-terminal domain-containing protein n=1 Tax=Thalassospira xiamenensis M-5 = DSM 17429 TaxID=1123366 RepID=A0AB72UJN5_9PROT|nr:TcpQ domain-containing protein [Thalassospira xiamenensis]AJD54408.1 hypothetical protein TH3_21678 [Thalassospira xiamenensis M-5 = DSM 17429]SIT21964.1 Toxin co-regulated pilus biosynthesis protein Q [Thalassospira xiamenensis M-5 = DSM 17429]
MTSKRIAAALFASSAALITAGSSHAAFLWEQSDPAPKKELPAPSITELGSIPVNENNPQSEMSGLDGKPVSLIAAPKASLDDAFYRGFGTDLPLSMALAQIPPSGVTVEPGYGVDVNQQVSWTGNKHWKVALEEAAGPTLSLSKLSENLYLLARRPDTQVAMETIKSEPLIAPTEAPVTNVPVADAPLKPENPFDGVVFSDEVEIPKIEACPDWIGDPGPRRTWQAEAGQTLEEVLRDWTAIGAATPWTLIWNTNRIYPIKASAEFEGYFCEALSLITAAFTSDNHPIRANGAQRNKVLVISTLDDMEAN